MGYCGIFPNMGLSPRVRGNRGWAGHGVGPVRSIPARAGEPARRRESNQLGPVYPRACGGTADADDALVDLTGLSPRVRGNRRFKLAGSLAIRSIPARAGEPAGGRRATAGSGVYPRACGGTISAMRWGKSL